MERYEIKDKKLIIVDKDLNIEIFEDFSIPTFENIDGAKICLDKNRAFLKKEGFLHGQSLFFNKNNVIEHISYYYFNKLHGPSIFYGKDKRILSITWFCFGKKQGICKRYYLSKAIYCIEKYKDGLFEKEQKYFYENGNIKTIMYFEKNVLKKSILYFENGTVKRKWDAEKNIDEIYTKNGMLINGDL